MSKLVKIRRKFRETVTFQAILLGASTLVAATLLSFGNLATKDEIALRLEEDLKASIAQVMPPELYENDLLKSALTVEDPTGASVLVYRATKDGVVTAVIFEVSEYGYSGEIKSILAISSVGTILGARVLAHSETPGLGDKIEVKKDDWILGFDGLSIIKPTKAGWAVRKDGGEFDQFSGATITPRAVVKSIRSGLEFFEAKKQDLLRVQTETNQ